MTRTANGDFAYDNSRSSLVEFFSKAGSLFTKRGSHYGGETQAVDLFKPAFSSDNETAMKLAFWLRDCRGGAGNRSGFKEVIAWLAEKHTEWVSVNLHFIPELGRWDDLIALIGTPCEDEALAFWVRAIQDGHGLAAKWAPREKNNGMVFSKMRNVAEMTSKEFRKLLVKGTNVVETLMCQKDWYEVDYNKIPSVAMARYNNAFKKNDGPRFDEYKDKLTSGDEDTKINASVLFPHDVIRTLWADIGSSYGHRRSSNFNDSQIANAQFKALPDFMDGTDQRIMSICDFSASMNTGVSGSVTAMDVSMSLGLYCSDRVGKDNPFYRKFVPFSDHSRLVDWKDDTFSVAAQKHNDGFCGSTNIEGALDNILQAAQMFNATNDQIPNVLLIISDMQWNQGTGIGWNGDGANMTAVEQCMVKWEEAGYNRPRIVYWNTAGYGGQPTTVNHQNVALISGFSPSLLKAVLGGEDFSPMAVLRKAIEKYEVVVPENVQKEVEEV